LFTSYVFKEIIKTNAAYGVVYMKKSCRSLTTISFTSALIVFSSSVSAQFMQNLTIGSPKAMALAHAVTADPPGIDSIHFNPAGLAKIKSNEFNSKFFGAYVTIEASLTGYPHEEGNEICPGTSPGSNACLFDIPDPLRPDDNPQSKTSNASLILPFNGFHESPALAGGAGGFALSKEGSRFTFANAFYMPLVVGFNRDDDDFARYNGKEVALTRINYLSPSVGIRVTDKLSVGISVAAGWQGMGLDLDMRAPNLGTAFLSAACDDIGGTDTPEALVALCGADIKYGPYDDVGNFVVQVEDSFSVSANVGFLYQVNNWLTVGAVYQSKSTANMKGEFHFNYSNEWDTYWDDVVLGTVLPGAFPAGYGAHGDDGERGAVELKMVNPQHIAVGLSMIVTPLLKVNFDVKWTDQSTWDNLVLKFDQDLDFLTIADTFDNIIELQDGPRYSGPNYTTFTCQYEAVTMNRPFYV